jgi:hypothetical protein
VEMAGAAICRKFLAAFRDFPPSRSALRIRTHRRNHHNSARKPKIAK